MPVLPDTYEWLGVYEMGVWLVDAFVQRELPMPTDDLSWKALSAMRSDALAMFHERDHDTPLAVWRMRFADAASAQAMLELAAWPESIEARRDDRDVILLASAAVEERALLADSALPVHTHDQRREAAERERAGRRARRSPGHERFAPPALNHSRHEHRNQRS